MSSLDVIIGIDPDIDKSGLAVINRKSGKVSVDKLAFPQLVQYLASYYEGLKVLENSACVFIEGGWLNESNWHVPKGASGHYGAAIGESVGRNQAVGMLLEQMMKHHEVPCEVVKPLPKTIRIGRRTLQMWKGNDGKITKEELEKVVLRNGLEMPKGRMNQDQRDAVLIALYHGGYRITK